MYHHDPSATSKKLRTVSGILSSVEAKITGITDAELSLIGMFESWRPDNWAAPGRLEY